MLENNFQVPLRLASARVAENEKQLEEAAGELAAEVAARRRDVADWTARYAAVQRSVAVRARQGRGGSDGTEARRKG